MATALSKEELDNEDYYSLLNVRREASCEEPKAAYRRLCMLYHPDKHRDPGLKSQAERLFNLVHQAYEGQCGAWLCRSTSVETAVSCSRHSIFKRFDL